MSLLNAGFLPWLLFAAVPVVLHLLGRRARRVQPLPTARFLQRALAAQSPARRVRQPLLLLLRMLTVVAIVLAFAKPTVPAFVAGRAGQGRRVVIVLDVSRSMQYRSGGLSTFDRARALATGVLDGLRAGDCADVVLAGASPRALNGRLTSDIGALRAELAGLQPTDEGDDAPAALALAASLLPGVHGEVNVVSDFQRASWRAEALGRLPATVRLIVLPAAGAERPNLAVTRLTLRPRSAAAGQRASLEATVWNGTPAARTLRVRLAEQEAAATVAPYAAAPVQTAVTAPGSSGALQARLEGTQDGLAADDRMRVTPSAGDVLVLAPSTRPDTNSAGYRLALAADPAGAGRGGAMLRLASEMPGSLGRVSAVVVAPGTVLAAPQQATLRAYLEGGGGIVAFVGAADGPRMADALARVAGVAPLFGACENTPRGSRITTVADSPLLRLFRDPTVADLGAARLTRRLKPAVIPRDAGVAARFSDGGPAVVELAVGRGALALCNFSPGAADGDLGIQPIFAALMGELIGGVGADGARARADAESDLRSLDAGELKRMVAGRPEARVVAGARQTEALADLTRSVPLWPYCILAALGFMTLEGLLLLPARNKKASG